MNRKKIRGIIGITDEGQPIVTADYYCPHFLGQAVRLTNAKECWYCQYADFRKTCDITLTQSICRCRQNQVYVPENEKNEQLQAPQFDKFASNIKGGVITCIFDFETQSSKAVYINSGWTAITGYTLEELNKEMNGNPQALVYEEDKPNADLEYREQMQRGNEYALLYRVIRKGGVKIWVIDRGIATCLPDGSIQNQSIVTEVTEIKEQEESLRRLAQLDQLTDLYNKATFAQQTKMVLGRQSEKLHAVIILDIDDFKKVNDIMGHAYGDKVLESVSDCLKGVFRNRDVLGRIGGDEFMILMTDIPNMEAAAQKTKELCGIMHEIKIGNGEALTVSLGIALSTDGEDYDEIFQKADIALYRAKNSGKNQAVFFK